MTGFSPHAAPSRASHASTQGADRSAEPLAGLNPAQREAVLHHEGPLLVLAGAGSGKTRVLTTRIAHLIQQHGVDPREILAVTFTNKAAGEMRERLARLLGHEPSGMWVGTFHAIGARLLRIHAPLVGRTQSFTIYDEDDSLGRVRRIMERLNISAKEWAPKAILSSISDAKNRLVPPSEFASLASDPFSRVVTKVYDALEPDLRAQNAATFDDLLTLPVQILRENQSVLEQYRRRFRFILVDEYQDTNRAQYRFVTLLAGGHGNVCVVGDDDQCLVRGTPITMADGSVRAIEDVRVGDEVRTGLGSGRLGAKRVLRTHAKRFRGEAVAITVEDVAGARRRIVSTPEHTHFAGFVECPADVDVTLALCSAIESERRHSISVRHGIVAARSSFASVLELARTEWNRGGHTTVTCVAELGLNAASGTPVSLPFIAAESVLRGMVMFDEHGDLLRVVACERVQVDDRVYDLDIEDTHNYVAEGILTHNSIYGWRGADIRNILDFERDFPKATIVRLEENYRSAAPILEMANTVIEANTGRMGKTLRPTRGGGERVTLVRALDERDEADWVAEEIATRRGASRGLELRQFAVLYRTNAQSRPMEEAFRKRQIPYRLVGATRFYDRREIRDLVSYLKLIANPADDEAFTRAVAVPKRGIGDTSIDTLAEAARGAGVSMLEAAARPEIAPSLRSAARIALRDFAAFVAKFREQAKEAAVDELLRGLVESLRYGDYLKSEGPGWEDRRDNVQALIDSAAETVADEEGEVGLTPLDHFLQRAMLVAGTDQLDPSADAVTMMTIHNAKGLEFPYVFITGLEDGLFPLSKAFDDPSMLEEERRLFYVGITRAERKLYVMHAAQRRRNGELMRSKASRFLDDVPPGMLEERKTLPFRSQPVGYGSDYGGGYGGAGGGSRWGQRTSERGGSGWGSARGGAGDARGGKAPISDFTFDDFADSRAASRRPGRPVAIPTAAMDAAESQEATTLAIGARVKHRKFGAGTITATTGSGRDTKVRIDFDDEEIGQKTLVLAQANLEPADE